MATHTNKQQVSALERVLTLVYGIVCYLVFLVTSLYTIGFVGNLFVPKTIDVGTNVSFVQALLVDIILLSLFAIQHSVMARPAFKRWWTAIIPHTVERSTYVLFAGLLLLLLFWQWLPIQGTIWNVEQTVGGWLLLGLYFVGWLVVLLSTFAINHFDLFGLRQVYLHWRTIEYTNVSMRIPLFYKLVRHPLMVGFLITFWATPRMSVGHLLFSLVMTGYILVGIQLEERDLVTSYGEAYKQYQQRVRMLLPVPKKGSVSSNTDTATPQY